MQLNLRSSCCIFILLFLLTFSKNVIAQTSTVTGKVTDDAGNPLQGVSVSLKGTSTGTTTTADGTYRLPVERRRGDALIFSYVGLADKELPIGNNTEVFQTTISFMTASLKRTFFTGIMWALITVTFLPSVLIMCYGLYHHLLFRQIRMVALIKTKAM